jgi:hypothetical protein
LRISKNGKRRRRVRPNGQPLRRPRSHPDWPSEATTPIMLAGIKASPPHSRSEPLPVRAPPLSGPPMPPVTAVSASVSHERSAAATISELPHDRRSPPFFHSPQRSLEPPFCSQSPHHRRHSPRVSAATAASTFSKPGSAVSFLGVAHR